MTRLLDLFRLIPGSARVLTFGLIIAGAIYFVYYQWGLIPAVFVGVSVLLIAGLIFAYNSMVKASEKQSGKAFGKAIRNSQVGASRGEIRQAVGELGDKWQEAIVNFKDHELSLYELPWFMLVGEPQSGKSTTLKFSGLKFPIGTESISGGGGTRNCDWWFTEEGIILDTAGRFTFQETTATDAAEWNHFLTLLAKYRPYCPINGIIFVIPVTSLLGDDHATREQKARNISDKLHHIQRTLAIQFPVFVLLTKADTIYGFTEFFNKLTPDQQREMLGWSNQVLDSGFDLETFDKSYKDIQKRIHQIRMRNLSRPQYSHDANKTFIFPEEFEMLFEPLRHYLSVIFESSVYKTNLFFRGYYFTSGMQEGQPIVRACRNIVKTGALSANLEKIFAKSRAFFIRDFYTQKVFPEQGLVQRGFQHLKSDRLKKRVIYSLNAVLLVLGALFVFYMHHNLTTRLNEPKAAITQTLNTLQQVKGDFFSSPESRAEVYRNLKSLKSSLSSASEASYLLFLKGKQNSLTQSLQDSFAYLYLDRVLTGMFDSTVHQLSAFSMKNPRSDKGELSSAKQLETITAALAELNKWRYQVALHDEDDFNPTIKPFLPLVLNPQWDKDLAKFRHEQTILEEFDQWFQEVYSGSSKKVQATLIRDLVRRSDSLFENLHQKVVDFYLNQIEMKRYLEKLSLLENIQAQYGLMKQPFLSAHDFEQKLDVLAPFFSQENLDLFAKNDGAYLSFKEIRERTITATGSEFIALMDAASSLSSKDKKRQSQQIDAVQFVNQLIAVDETQLEDPAKDREQALSIPAEAMEYWTRIGQKYHEEYLNLAHYQDFPNEEQDQEENLESLFEHGAKRGNLLKSIFVTGVFNVAGTMALPDDKASFDDIYSELRTLIQQEELNTFDRALIRVSRINPIRAPRPKSSNWNPLVREFDRLTDSGMDYDRFFSSLEDFRDAVEKTGSSRLKAIYGKKDTPLDIIKDYHKEMGKKLKKFAQNIQSLNMISNDDIASNRRKYQGNFREKSALIQLTRLEEDPHPLIEVHLHSMEASSSAILEAFQNRVGRAEICPSCPGMLSEIKAALFLVRHHFPVVYKGTSHNTSPDPGVTTVSITMADKKNLDDLIAALEKFQNPTPQQKQYLKRRGLLPFFKQASRWVAFVNRLQSGSISLSYKLTATNEPDSIARTFSFADLSGFYKARTLSLNSPSFRMIEKNPNNEQTNLSAIFRLYNDTEGNRARSLLKISGGELELLAFVLDSVAVSNKKDVFDKTVPFLLNVNQQHLNGTFRFKLSEPVVDPPNWKTLE
jgi:hypothetical protein